MKKIYINPAILRSSVFWVLLLIGSYFLLSYYPEYYQYTHQPEGRVYLGFDHFPIDILGEMSEMQQGARGNWLVYPSATSAVPARGFFLRVEYLFLGHLSHWLNLSPLLTYHLARFVLSCVFIAFIWYIICRNFPDKTFRLIALGLVLFATGLFPKNLDGSWSSIIRFDTNVFQRLTIFKIQYLIGAAGSTFSLFCFYRLSRTNRLRYFLLAAASGMIAANSHVFGEFTVSISVILYSAYLMRKDRSADIFRKNNLWLISYLLLMLLPVLNLYHASFYFDWNQYIRAEKDFALPFSAMDYFRYNGITIIPALIGIIMAFKQKKDFFVLLSLQLIACISVFLINTGWPFLNPLRIIQVPVYIPLGILTAFALMQIYGWLKKHNLKPFVSVAVITGIVLILVISGRNAYITSLSYFAAPDPYQDGQYGYVYKNEYDAISWLANRPQGMVISSDVTGALICALSPQTAYSTVWLHFYVLPEKQTLADNQNAFFTGRFTDKTAGEFLRSYHIRYVYVGENELHDFSLSGNTLPYASLKPVYRNPSVAIYTY
jgi:hypothetical protein